MHRIAPESLPRQGYKRVCRPRLLYGEAVDEHNPARRAAWQVGTKAVGTRAALTFAFLLKPSRQGTDLAGRSRLLAFQTATSTRPIGFEQQARI